MTSKYELECQLRDALRVLLPKAPGKMKKHELEHTLAALNYKGEIKQTIPEPKSANGTNPPRLIPNTVEGGIRVPLVPKERVSATSTKEEKAALRKSMGLPEVTRHIPLAPSLPYKKAEVPRGLGAGLMAYHEKRRAEKAAAAAAAVAAGTAPPEVPRPKAPKAPKAPKEPEQDVDLKAVRIVRAHAIEPNKKPLGRPPKAPKTDTAVDPAMLAQFEAFLKTRENRMVEQVDEDEDED